MIISLNEIKKLVPKAKEIQTEELVKIIGSRLVEVEETIYLSKKYSGIYIVKVEDCEPIPETHLHLCQINVGNAVSENQELAKNVKNVSEKGLVQVVCGAPNVRSGMLAVWIAPGSIVPQTFGEENFKLNVRKLRGFESNGMLAAIDELDLGESHDGIVVIDPAQKNTTTGNIVQPGDDFAAVFGLNDTILDIENKSLTHRPDTFGIIGFAREVAGILGEKFEEGEIYQQLLSKNIESINVDRGQNVDEPIIEIKDAELCPHYSCAVIEMDDALTDEKYLTEMDVFLAKASMRGISKIVDITNYLMLMTGQPLHAFDYDKFVKVGSSSQPKIIVRSAKDGEKLQLLDGKTIECDSNDILITSNDVPVALAGAMGGASTEIDASTKRIILESATFSLYHLRKTQMKHGIFSEAITRFTKGQSAAQVLPVLAAAIKMLGGKTLAVADNYAEPVKTSVVKITTEDINSLLGSHYDTSLIRSTLENVGFIVQCDCDEKCQCGRKCGEKCDCPCGKIRVTAPLWRTDIHIKEDIIEEVGRLLGYDNIALDYPMHPFSCTEMEPMLSLKTRLRDIMSERLGAHEILTYSFVSKKLQEVAGENVADSYELVNSISPELQCFRQSLTPSLLEKIRDNLKAGYRDFALYEINQITKKSYGFDEDGVPKLYTHLAYATTGDYYQMKAVLVALLGELGFSGSNLDFHKYDGHFTYLEPLHSATISTPHVCCGEVKQGILKRMKIDQTISVFEISLDQLLVDLPAVSSQIPQISKYPSVERDLTIKVLDKYAFSEAENAIRNALSDTENLIFDIKTISIYQPGDDSSSRNISFRLHFASLKKTLTSEDISAIMKKVTGAVKTAVGAEVI